MSIQKNGVKKRIISFWLVLCLLFSNYPLMAFATTEDVQENIIINEDTSDVEVYSVVNISCVEVYTAEDLLEISDNISSGKNSYKDMTIVICNNIDMSGKTWNPLGNTSKPFRGSIRGNGYTISGLSCSQERSALIGYMSADNECTIENLNINISKFSGKYSGGLISGLTIGDSGKVIINNCKVNGTINGISLRSGGIVGTFDASGGGILEVLNCDVNMYIYSDYTWSDSYAVVGGIIGETVNSGTSSLRIMNCNVAGTLKTYVNYGYCTSSVGGLIGTSRVDNVVIEQCSSTAYVQCEAYYAHNGGMVGVIDLNTTSAFQIGNSYVNATINAKCINGTSQGGGLIGRTTGSGGKEIFIANTYVAGSISASNKAAFVCWHAGNECPEIRNSFFNKDTLGPAENEMVCKLAAFSTKWLSENISNSKGISTAAMKQKSSYKEWDFDSVWTFETGKNSNYPILWQKEENAIKNNCQYTVKVVDSLTKKGINRCEIILGENEKYITDDKGIAKIIIDDVTKYLDKEIIISSMGYKDYICQIKDFWIYGQNVIKLQSDNPLCTISNICFDQETIAGPSINIMGQEVPLFTVDIGLDFSNISGLEALGMDVGDDIDDFTKYNYVKVDEAQKTVKIMIGLDDNYKVSTEDEWNKDFQSFKEYYKRYNRGATYTEMRNAYDDRKSLLKKFDTKVVFDCEAAVCGFLELDYSTGEIKFKEGGFVFTAGASVERDIPMGTWFYATFGLEGEIEGKPYFKCNEVGVPGLELDASFEVKPSIEAGAMLLVKELLSAGIGIEGKIKGEITLPAESLAEALAIYLGAQVFFRMNLLVFETKFSSSFPNVELYPNIGDLEPAQLMMLSVEDNTWNMISRDYLADNEISIMSLTDTVSNSDAISNSITYSDITLGEENVYPYVSPKLAKCEDGRILATWVTDNGTKSDNNRTTLYYSIYESGSWTEPTAVYESGKADFLPQISVDGNNVHLVWQRASQEFGENITINEMLESTELVYSRLDGDTFSEPVIIAENIGKYQMHYSIAAENDVVIVSWLENSGNDYTMTAGENNVYSRIWEGNEWGNINVVLENGGDVLKPTCGFLNGVPQVAYSVVDSEASDYELYISGMRITANDAEDISVTYQNDKFYWLENGVIHYYDGTQNVSTDLFCSSGQYIVLEDAGISCILMIINEGFKNELYISYHKNYKYTNPVVLTQYEKHIAQYDAVISEGQIMTLMSLDNLSEDENEFPYTTTDMVCQLQEVRKEIALDNNVIYDEELIQRGNRVTFKVNANNLGMADITTYSLMIKDENENILTTAEYAECLETGGTKELAIDYVIPDDFVQQKFDFVLSADGDVEQENNIVSITLGTADVKIVNYKYSNGIIRGRVQNTGYAAASDVVLYVKYFNQDQILETIEIGELGLGESYSFEYEIPAEYQQVTESHVANKFCLIAETSSEESSYVNNEYEMLVEPVHVSAISLDKSAVSMCVGDETKLTALIQPTDAVEQEVIWITDATDIAVVDDTGNVTGISAGTATITAISKDTDVVAYCTVKVSNHNYSPATCTTPEICTLCGKIVKDALGHTMTFVPAKVASCLAGNNAYYSCSTCSGIYKDEAAQTETTLEAETIKAVQSHVYNGNECTVCGSPREIVINMTDSYGDGWNGNAIQVYADGGDEVIGIATFDEGTSATWSMTYDPNTTYTFRWAQGRYAGECSFYVSVEDKIIFEATPKTCANYESNEVVHILKTTCNHESMSGGFCVVCEKTCGKEWSHEFNEKQTCDICGYICGSKETPHNWSNLDGVCALCKLACEHINEDDGDCTTVIVCSICNTVTTEAKAEHTPKEDDGDCTTAVKCSECDTVITPAKDSHTDINFDAYCDVCNTRLVESISMDQETLQVDLNEGTEVQLSCIIQPETITAAPLWNSSNPLVAEVDQNGKVTAYRVGTTEITATLGDMSASCVVTVTGDTYTVTFDSVGGEEVSVQVITKGTEANKPEEPTKEGFTFIGWYLEGSDIPYDFDTMVTSDIVLYAKWEVKPDNLALNAIGIAAHWTVDDAVMAENSGSPLSRIKDDNYTDYGRHGLFGQDSRSESSYIQLDLGQVYEVASLNLYRYWEDSRTYDATVIAVSQDSEFKNKTILYNSDTSGEVHELGIGTDEKYPETSAGKEILVKDSNGNKTTVDARYVRVYMCGQTKRTQSSYNENHIVELQVWGYELLPEENYADLEALNVAIANAETKVKDNYTEESFNAMTTVLQEAKKLLNATINEQDRVDAAAEALNTAVEELVLCVQPLQLTAANLVLHNDITVNYKVNADVFEAYEDVELKIVFRGETKTITESDKKDGKYVFVFEHVAPHLMNENMEVTLYATRNGEAFESTPINYSIAIYCYNTLAKYSNNEKLRTLVVDLLNYGSAAQTYVAKDEEAVTLVNAGLSDEQKKWATVDMPEITSVTNTEYEVREDAIVTWRAGTLLLNDAVTVIYEIEATDTKGLQMEVKADGATWHIKDFEPVDGTDNRYRVYFDELNAAQMSSIIETKIVNSQGEAVSNTMRYSIESYVKDLEELEEKPDPKLQNLVNTMIMYGYSAADYVQN